MEVSSPGAAVPALPPTPASVSQGVNELQTAFISPPSLREISPGKWRERNNTHSIVSEDNWVSVVISRAKSWIQPRSWL